MLETSQAMAEEQMEINFGKYSAIYSDAGIIHIFFKNNILSFAYPTQTVVSQDNLYHLTNLVKNFSTNVETGTIDLSGNYYYRMHRIDEATVVVSIIEQNYGNEVETEMVRKISNSTAYVFSIIFILLLLWVATIIMPIQQIINYIKKVNNNDKDAKLNIDRDDEIGQLANALVTMRNEIKLQEETKEEMIHNISHDLKTPIATIKSYAQSIRDGIYPYDTLDKSVDVIIANSERLEKKVYSLLFLNRVDYVMEQEANSNQTTDMTELVGSVLVQLKMIRPEIHITTDIIDTVFRGDPESWYVVLSNLLDNALRYAVSNVHITVKDHQLSISNDGEKIDSESLKKIFKPFEKGNKGKFGLGLSICAKITNAYGYSIRAENTDESVIFIIEAKETEQPKEKKTILPIKIDKK